MMIMKKMSYVVLCAGLMLGATGAQAQLRVEITGVGSNQIPVAIANFDQESVAPQPLSSIIKADLARSGAFKLIDADTAVAETANINFDQWKGRGADALAAGSVQQLADGRLDVRYKLFDTIKGVQLSSMNNAAAPQFNRLLAHKIADDIYEKLTGVKGAFSTRIAYVTQTGREYRLEVADADGEGIQVALRSNEPIISPAWSPDGTKVAYVSFEKKKPIVYVQNLVTRQRTIVSNEKGSNSAPNWSPDGSRLAVALSRDGHTQIYVVNADGSGLRRLSNSSGIDTEPQFSADGQSIYFTSDRGGQPQIYKMSAQGESGGGPAQRVTFHGGYNTSPRVSPDGKELAYISRIGGAFKLYVQDLSTGDATGLTDTTRDESPSFAANGQYILYATYVGGRGVLAAVSVDGTSRQVLSVSGGNVSQPSWGPFMQ